MSSIYLTPINTFMLLSFCECVWHLLRDVSDLVFVNKSNFVCLLIKRKREGRGGGERGGVSGKTESFIAC